MEVKLHRKMVKVCKFCGEEVIRAKWYHYLPFIPTLFIYLMMWKTITLYRHKKGLFTDCRAFLMCKENVS